MLDIPLWRLAFALLPVAAVAWIAFRWSGSAAELPIATARMVVQLLAMGYLLVFLFEFENPWVATAVMLFMVGVSSWIAIRTVRRQRFGAWLDALAAVGLGGGSVLALVVFGVLGLEPWYELRYLVPIAGMVLANAMTAVTLSAERFEAERANGRAAETARQVAWNAALIPQINAFLSVGLVSLPGMMTGQILAGTSPLIAVRYQIMVMAMVLSSAALAAAIFLVRQCRRLEPLELRPPSTGGT